MFNSIMNESGRWLVGKGKIDRAINILKVIAKRNSRRVEDSIWRSFEVAHVQMRMILRFVYICHL